LSESLHLLQMPTGTSIAEQLAVLGVQLLAWPEEPEAPECDDIWIQRGLNYAEGIQLWRAQLRNASVSTKAVVEQLICHLQEQGELGVWDQLVYAAIKPEVQGAKDFERWQACTKLIRSSALTAAQLLGASIEMMREQRLTAGTYGLRRLLKEHDDLKPEQCVTLISALFAAANTANTVKDASNGSTGWATAVKLHRHWASLLADSMKLVAPNKQDATVPLGVDKLNLLDNLDCINQCLGSKGAHGHAEFIRICRERLPELLSNWDGEKPWVVEVGCSREIIEGQNSTAQLLAIANELSLPFAGIDLDQDNIAALKRDYGGLGTQWIAGKGEDELVSWHHPIAACYLDAYDFWHTSHSDLRQESYLRNYGAQINDQECHQMHIQAAQQATRIIPIGGVLGLDDTWFENDQWAGKGTLALPWLLEHGWQLISQANRGTVLVKTSESL